MGTIVLSVPSGAHHRSLLQPLRELFLAERGWKVLVISPGAPWSDRLFPFADYPRGRFSFTENGAAEHVLQQLRPALLVTTTAGLDPADPPLLEAAQSLGIRTATFIESWDNVWKMERVARGRGKPGQRIVLADHLLVWNEPMKAHLLRAFPSLRPEHITVTGAPRLDYFGPRYASLLPSREEVFRGLGLDPTKRLLHLATTELYEHDHVAKAIAEARERDDLPGNLHLYASVHPGGNLERHRPWAERYGFTLRFSPGRSDTAPHPDFRYNPSHADMLLLAATLKETDVMVNLSSTVALESCLADRPTICAFFGKPFDWLRWNRSMVVRDFREHYADLLAGGGIAVARNPTQLTAQIRASLAHPEQDRDGRRRSAERVAGTLAGDASARALSVLRELVAGTSPFREPPSPSP